MTHPGELQNPPTVVKSEHDRILGVIAVLGRLVARSFRGKKREELLRIDYVLEQRWSA